MKRKPKFKLIKRVIVKSWKKIKKSNCLAFTPEMKHFCNTVITIEKCEYNTEDKIYCYIESKGG